MEKNKWIEEFFNLYIEGLKEKAPSSYIDYFKARGFILEKMEEKKQSLLAEVEQLIESLSFTTKNKVGDNVNMLNKDQLIEFLKLIKEK